MTVRKLPLQIYGLSDDVQNKITEIAKTMGLSDSAWARMIILREIKKVEKEES